MKVSSLAVAAAVSLMAAPTVALDRKFYGLNYDTRGYDADGCKYESQVAKEFRAFNPTSNFVRIYSTSCTAKILRVAEQQGLKVWIGLWSEVPTAAVADAFESEFANLKRLVDSRTVRNDNVLGVQVSSEALYRYYIQGNVTATNLKGYNLIVDHVTRVRDYLRSKSLTIPVTAADVMDVYNMFPNLYSTVDVVSVNQFSMWENKTAAEGVGSLFGHWQKVQKQARAAGKPVLLSETGWSTADDEHLVAEASPAAQALYTKEFLSFAEKQSINYYYFSAIDLSIHAQLIEKSFGIFDANANLKSGIQGISVGSKPIATRLFHNDKVLKVDPDNWNALLVEAPGVGPGANLDNEIWFYYPDSQTYYSKSSNQCLDAYGNSKHPLNVHVYACTPGNANQNWQLTEDGQLKSLNGANQCMDVDPKQKDKVVMWWCYDGPNQKFRRVDAKDQPTQILAAGNAYLNEWYSGVSFNAKMSLDYAANALWFYDPVTQQLKSKSSNTCLDGYLKDGSNYAVHTHACGDDNSNQKWQYNDVTGQWMYMGRLGLCLAASGGAGALDGITLQPCDKAQANQKWTFKLA
nr:secreted protein [Achlya hypogyna]